MNKYKTPEEYIVNHKDWQQSLILLRNILLSTQMSETIKWGAPVYTFGGKNIVGIGGFKSYVGIWFFQGALLNDKKKKLINAQEGKTKALRQWRFNSVKEIEAESKTIKQYLKEAILNQKQGKEIKPERKKLLEIPKELNDFIKKDKKVKESFNSLSLSKQIEYAEYISEAKRDETKLKRLLKIALIILKGKGLNDKYR
ncbi:MAG: DUF1801 domain-containing protein [Bacteroidetes bacterium]|nr:DUF1801 domain-containing protein [Bacteroidota bacterium]